MNVDAAFRLRDALDDAARIEATLAGHLRRFDGIEPPAVDHGVDEYDDDLVDTAAAMWTGYVATLRRIADAAAAAAHDKSTREGTR